MGNYGKGIPLGHTLFAVQEVAVPIHIAHHQSGHVVIAGEGELHATRPLESDSPHH